MKKLTVIVPAYNEQANIKPFYDEVIKYLNHPNYEFSILFVSDGSKDGTIDEVKKLRSIDKRIRYISFSRNFGKEAAMYAGMEACKDDDAVIVIDCDLQHPPVLIPEMLKLHEEGYNIVYTRQRSRKGDSKIRRFFAKKFYSTFNKFSDCHMDGSTKDFQLLDKIVVDAFLKIKDNNRFMKGIFSWVGFKRKCLEFDFVDREVGKSKWSFKGLFKYGFNGLNQFSNVLITIPILLIVLNVLWLVGSVCLFIFAVWSLEVFLISLMVTTLGLGFSVTFYFLFYLLYQIRRQGLDRPIYLVEESSDEKNN